jgi:serine/threonine-protein kinase
VLLTVALSLLAVGLVLFKFWPRSGDLTVTVSGPNRAPVDMLEIQVDNRTVCKQSPCAVTKLLVGAHTVDVTAPGYVKSATRAAEIEYGQTAQVEFSLTPATTGVRVGALAPNLRLFVDGNDRGPLPASLDDLTPGSHSMRIEGSDRFKPFEQQFALGPGEIKTLEPKLKVAKGLAKLEPGENAKGARVWLTCNGDPKVELALPTVKEVAVDKGCRVEASKRGFENTSLDLSFEDGSPEKSFSVDLAQKGAAAPAPAPVARVSHAKPAAASKPAVEKPAPAPKPAVEKPAPAPKPAVEKPAPAPKPAGPTGTININSMPVSSVTVDGNAAGQTPVHVNVAAGTHTVVFTHPEKGRKSVTVKVKAGASTSAVVRFD